MADWKAMYLSLTRDIDKAIHILEKGQEKCEEMYLRSEDLLLSSTQDETSVKREQEGEDEP